MSEAVWTAALKGPVPEGLPVSNRSQVTAGHSAAVIRGAFAEGAGVLWFCPGIQNVRFGAAAIVRKSVRSGILV